MHFDLCVEAGAKGLRRDCSRVTHVRILVSHICIIRIQIVQAGQKGPWIILEETIMEFLKYKRTCALAGKNLSVCVYARAPVGMCVRNTEAHMRTGRCVYVPYVHALMWVYPCDRVC